MEAADRVADIEDNRENPPRATGYQCDENVLTSRTGNLYLLYLEKVTEQASACQNAFIRF